MYLVLLKKLNANRQDMKMYKIVVIQKNHLQVIVKPNELQVYLLEPAAIQI